MLTEACRVNAHEVCNDVRCICPHHVGADVSFGNFARRVGAKLDEHEGIQDSDSKGKENAELLLNVLHDSYVRGETVDDCFEKIKDEGLIGKV